MLLERRPRILGQATAPGEVRARGKAPPLPRQQQAPRAGAFRLPDRGAKFVDALRREGIEPVGPGDGESRHRRRAQLKPDMLVGHPPPPSSRPRRKPGKQSSFGQALTASSLPLPAMTDLRADAKAESGGRPAPYLGTRGHRD